MPNLPDRVRRENELTSAISSLFSGLAREVRSGAADYIAFSVALAEELRSSLLGTHMAAARALIESQSAPVPGDLGRRSDYWASNVASLLAAGIAANTKSGIEAAVQRGGSADYLFSQERAASIAITETTRAISEGEAVGAMLVAILIGAAAAWFWNTEDDGRVCQICSDLHDQKSPPIQPPAHPGCRCEKRWSFTPLLVGV